VKTVRLFFLLALVAFSAMADGRARLSPEHTAVGWLCDEESYEIDCGRTTYYYCCGTLSSCLSYCEQICGGICTYA
jgi:hypothetical protein